ncbi:MAG: L,D-transpeptidase [Sandaracinus sp.]
MFFSRGGRRSSYPRALLVALALVSCEGAYEAPEAGLVDTGAPVPARVSAAPTPAARPREITAPTPAPRPVVDAEAEARARAEAERAAYEAAWPMHGVCYHYLGQVHARPDGSSRVVGYMRRGSHFRAREGLRGPGCARGWHEVEGNGYVCRGEGFQIGTTPQTFEPSPVPPSASDALPYAYARVGRADAPEYWRLPSADEEARAATLMETLRERAALATARAEEAARAAATQEGEPVPEAEPGLEAPPGAVEVTGEASAEPALVDTPVELPDFFRQRLQQGFYVSLDAEVDDGARHFYRTIRGAYVPADAMTPAEPPSMRGVVLEGRWHPPVGFVFRRGATALIRDTATGLLRDHGEAEYHRPMLLTDERIERRGGGVYRVARDGTIVRETAMRVIEPIARPAGIPEGDRWIHVDLSEQTLVAYEGERAVFATLVSTGREGFATPTGTFRIQSKHVSTTMDDPDSPTEAYSIEDVPWTMYFEGSYALHAAFWHDNFGRVRSHGCVNLAPADARWLFEWTTPGLPPGWHGVIAGPRTPGTWVHVTE